MFDRRQTATLVAALRYWKREGWRSDGREVDIASADGALEPLSDTEIEKLCETLQSDNS